MLLSKFIKNSTKIKKLSLNNNKNYSILDLKNLRNRFYFSQVQHKFNYGQGGMLNLNLTNRTYDIKFETIWEDYSLMSYSGLTGQNSLTIMEKYNQTIIDDVELTKNQNQFIKMNIKIPEDFTINGSVNGSIRHLKNNVSSKLRTAPFVMTVLGYQNVFQWLTLQCQKSKIQNLQGDININSLTLQDGQFNCQNFASAKVLFSNKVSINAKNSVKVRSIIAYGNAQCQIRSKNIQLESISGRVDIICQKVNIKRVLSTIDGIKIVCKEIDQLIIETGTGTIQILQSQNQSTYKQKVTLGKMHKGSILQQANNILKIIN